MCVSDMMFARVMLVQPAANCIDATVVRRPPLMHAASMTALMVCIYTFVGVLTC